nr:transposase [Bacillus proteolyticus]
MDIHEEYVQHISPFGWEHVTLTGDDVWNLNPKTNFNNLTNLPKEFSFLKRVKGDSPTVGGGLAYPKTFDKLAI